MKSAVSPGTGTEEAPCGLAPRALGAEVEYAFRAGYDGPFTLAFPDPAAALPQSVKIWPSPSPSARSSRAIMCSVLGRRLPFTQRKPVWR